MSKWKGNEMNNGIHRRWNWRTNQRIGPNAWKFGEKEVRKIMRRLSWRRAL